MSEFFNVVPDPINYAAHEYEAEGVGTKSLVEVPASMRLDWAIRAATERAVYASQETILEQTKLLVDNRLMQVGSVVPVTVPTSPQNTQLLDGDTNEQLKKFTDSVYDSIVERFNIPTTLGWYVVPYFEEGDDTLQIHKIGMFFNPEFTQTVVE